MIQRECRRAEFAKEAALLLQNFGAVEQTIEQDKHLDFSVSDRDVSVSASASVSMLRF